MNKKSGRPEELVSCADCGRSGECGPFLHPCPQASGRPPCTPATLPGVEGGVGKWMVAMIPRTEAFSGHWIVSYIGSQEIMPWEPGKREGRHFGPGFGLFMKWVFLDVCCCELAWEHLGTRAALSCSGRCTCNTKLRLFCGSAPGEPEDTETRKGGQQPHFEVWVSETPALLGGGTNIASIGHSSHFLIRNQERETLLDEGDKRAVF